MISNVEMGTTERERGLARLHQAATAESLAQCLHLLEGITDAVTKVRAAFARGHAPTPRLEEALYWCSVQALRALHVVKSTPSEKGARYG